MNAVEAAQPTLSDTLTLYEALMRQAERNPHAVAIMAPGRAPLTYGRLVGHVQDTVHALNAMGLGLDNRIAIVLPDGPEMAVAFLSVAAGATAVPLNPRFRADEFDLHLSGLNSAALLVEAGCDSPAVGVAAKRGIPIIELTRLPAANAGLFALKGPERPGPGPIRTGFARPDDVALVMRTSGTTSHTRGVPRTHTNMCTSAFNAIAAFQLTDADRCLNIMPLFNAHGLHKVFVSLAAGSGIVCAPGFSGTKFFEWLEEFRPTWYTAVPTMHLAILDQERTNPAASPPPALRFIRSGSAPLAPRVMADLECLFNAPVIDCYAMTETELIASNPLPPGKRKPGSVGVLAGPEVRIANEEGEPLPVGAIGEICVRGPNVTHGYEDDPDANESAFRNGWFHTGDLGCLDPEGYLFITGRVKEIINRGGEKVSPQEVDDVLMEHPAIHDAVTFAVPHKRLGEEVAAAVVLRAGAETTDRELREFVATRLAHFKVPRRVLIVDDLPKSPAGKPTRIGLADRLGLTPPDETPGPVGASYTAPRDALEFELVTMFEQVLDVRPVSVRDDFFDLGGDSMAAVRLFDAIAERLHRDLPLATLVEAPTVEGLAGRLLDEGWSPPWACLVAIQPNGSKLPFFAVHGAGGNILTKRNLARYLNPDQPFYGLQSRGLRRRDAPFTRIEDMATQYVDEIRRVQPEGPYLLGGFSMGGVIAFEMAHQLEELGQKVALLVALDSSAPGGHQHTSLAQRTQGRVQTLLSLPLDKRISYLIDSLGSVKRVAIRQVDAFCKERRDPILSTIVLVKRANKQAGRRYLPRAYSGRVTLFHTEARAFVTQPWVQLASGGLEIHEIPGTHNTIQKEPHVHVLAEKLTRCLDAAQQGLGPRIGSVTHQNGTRQEEDAGASVAAVAG